MAKTSTKQNTSTKPEWAVLIIPVLLLTSLIHSNNFTDQFILPKTFWFFFLASASIGWLVIRSMNLKYTKEVSFNKPDLLFLLFIIYQILRALFTKPINWENENLLVTLLSVVLYFLLKPYLKHGLKQHKTCIWLAGSFILLLFVQLVYGLLQYADALPRLQNVYKIGGAFGNPGVYANFLVPLLPFVLFILFARNKAPKNLYYLGWIVLILFLVIIPLTNARTAWIAVLVSSLYFFYYQFNLKEKIPTSVKNPAILIIGLIVMIGIIASASIYLYKLKEDSSSGRMLIWKISTEAIKEKPVFGEGFDQFAATYHMHQADYFRSAQYSVSELETADNINYAFNDYIQLTIESGLIGLVMFLLVIISVFFSKSRKKEPEQIEVQQPDFLIASRASLLAILVSSLFSYPLFTLPINAFFVLLLAIISSQLKSENLKLKTKPNGRRLTSTVGLILLIVFTANQLKKYKASLQWLEASQLAQAGQIERSIKLYENIYPVLSYNKYFVYNYGAQLSVMQRYLESNQVLTQLLPRLTDADVYLYMGNNYEGLGEYKKAIAAFQESVYTMPVRIFPRYRIALLYLKTGQKEKALDMAREILEMKVKVPSALTDQIRKEMRGLVAGE